jgi:electron transfer flavoprotein alpha subunit
MGKLIIDQSRITPDKARELAALCPFGAISAAAEGIEISSGCKMCRLCVKKSNGIITYAEDTAPSVDKSAWRGICVYVDHDGEKIHRVTYELQYPQHR